MTATLKEARRGRPATGTAKTSTERGKAADEALVAAGGRILGRLRLSPAGAAALDALVTRDGSDKAAVERALIDAAKNL